MNIEREIEKILEQKGVPPPGITPEQFMEKLDKRLFEAIPLMLHKTINGIANEIVVEELERIGRGEPCRHWRPRERCISSQKEPNCRDCTSYKPRSRRWRWIQLPESWELVLIPLLVVSFVAAMFAEEIRGYALCFWFGMLVVSRLNIWLMWRKLRKMKAI